MRDNENGKIRWGFDSRAFDMHVNQRSEYPTPHSIARGKGTVGAPLLVDDIHKHGITSLGTMSIASMRHGEDFTTGDDWFLARAFLPYTNGLFWLEGTFGIAHQLGWVVELQRLMRIKQLSLLCFPVRQGEPSCSIDFHHTRFLHTYDVIVHGLLCAHNAGIKGKDLIALEIALAIHDLFTPACGDLMKFVDFKRFDEDARLTKLLDHEPYVTMCAHFEIDPKEPIRICQERNCALSRIRDFADTLAYTARDLSALMGYFESGTAMTQTQIYENPEDQALLQELLRYRHDKSDFALLFEGIELDERGNLVFKSADRLKTFLRIRAILFRILYYNRQTRNVEYLLGIRLVKMLLGKGILTLEVFEGPNSDDGSIWSGIYKETGYNPSFMHNGAIGKTTSFETQELAEAHVKKFASDTVCGLIYKWPSQTRSKVNYWYVKTADGPKLWCDQFPNAAEEINRIIQPTGKYHVALINKVELPHMKEKYWQELKRFELVLL